MKKKCCDQMYIFRLAVSQFCTFQTHSLKPPNVVNMADASVPLTVGGASSSSGVGAGSGKYGMKPNFSSLPLQMCLFFGFHYAPFFFVLNLFLFTYKGMHMLGL